MKTEAKATHARSAAATMLAQSGADRRAALEAMHAALVARRKDILAANQEDLRAGKGLEPALQARLELSPAKFDAALDGLLQLAALDDPVGQTLRATRLDDGLHLYQVTAPIGVVACIFEARPDVCIQIPALTVRTGNAVLLKGGKEAQRTNHAIADALRQALDSTPVPADAVQILDGRDEVEALLAMDRLVDLIVPRGSNALVRHIQAHTRIPVLGHADGICHVYIDQAADVEKAVQIVIDAKVDSPSACNAVETVLVHRSRDDLKDRLREELQAAGVAVHEPGDIDREYGSLDVNLLSVPDLDAALRHIQQHGSKHTEAIVTEDAETARAFVARVDAAGVFVNASTRFADGYRYGLGAEVGISTGKIHARGPVGVDGLLSSRWLLAGDGHTAGAYHAGGLDHAPLDDDWTTERMLHG